MTEATCYKVNEANSNVCARLCVCGNCVRLCSHPARPSVRRERASDSPTSTIHPTTKKYARLVDVCVPLAGCCAPLAFVAVCDFFGNTSNSRLSSIVWLIWAHALCATNHRMKWKRRQTNTQTCAAYTHTHTHTVVLCTLLVCLFQAAALCTERRSHTREHALRCDMGLVKYAGRCI